MYLNGLVNRDPRPLDLRSDYNEPPGRTMPMLLPASVVYTGLQARLFQNNVGDILSTTTGSH